MPWRPAAAGARPGTLFGTPERRLLVLQSMWPHVVGAAVALNSLPVELRGNTLGVRVRDVRWRRALHRMHRDIIVRLRERGGATVAPARLGFLEGGLPPVAEHAPVPPRPEPVAPGVVADAASAIADPELRALFLRTAGRYLENTRAARPQRPRPGGDDHA
jgi:hypothetical protein